MKSRRLHVKSIFIGVVGRPCEEIEFDRKILFESVNEDVILERQETNQNISPDAHMNADMKG